MVNTARQAAVLGGLVVLACVVGTASGTACPNDCSLRGNCNTYGGCDCWTGYTGADCSLRSCIFAKQWVGFGTSTDNVHTIAAECSNKGTCDRKTGLCKCYDGFTGVGCERLACPGGGNCNGNGRCMSLRAAASTKDDFRLLYSTTYSLWDADKIYGCICDFGYEGYDCSLRSCPMGDDPRTIAASGTYAFDTNEVQTVTCNADGGTFKLTFRGRMTVDIAYNANTATVKAALEGLSTIYEGIGGSGDVGVSFSGSAPCAEGGTNTVITFYSATGDLPMLIADGTGLTRGGGTPSVSVAETTKGTREHLSCNGRGACDYSTGLCTCYAIGTNAFYQSGNGYNSAMLASGIRGDCGFIASANNRVAPYCPGTTACSDSGVCDLTLDTVPTPDYNVDRCTCFTGYTGGDCGLRTCPFNAAWFDEPTAQDTAHAMAECSNMGNCDRSTGKCVCAPGFDGIACQRTKCPSNCNGHGQCVSLKMMNYYKTDNGIDATISYGASYLPTTWDAEMMHGCACDSGTYREEETMYEFKGPACEEYTCPTGDNPSVTKYEVSSGVWDYQPNEKQNVKCIGNAGTFTLTFRKETTPPIDFDAPGNSDYVELTGLGTVTLTHMSATFTTSNDKASTFVANQYMVVSGSTDLTSSNTDVRYVRVTTASHSGVTTVTVSQSEENVLG